MPVSIFIMQGHLSLTRQARDSCFTVFRRTDGKKRARRDGRATGAFARKGCLMVPGRRTTKPTENRKVSRLVSLIS